MQKMLDNALGRDPKAQEEKDNSWLDYFSTHPQGEDRIKMLQAMAQNGKSFTPLLPQVDWEKLMHREMEKKNEK